ncbi:MAG TPA: hypothetical protein GX688_01285 [Clostridiales bacterium]|nr:hypothetical protein [Clostridiales bacterium]
MSKGKFIGKWTGVALVAILAVFVAPVPESYGASTFKDTKGHWAEQNIEAAAAQGIIKGYSDGRFKPDARVTRAEFVSMLNRALGNTATTDSGFTDVKSKDWYYFDVQKAVTAGYVDGFNDRRLRPDKNITRQEAAVMLSRLVPTYGYSTSLSRYTDYRSVADWASGAMERMSGKGYISGYTDGKIHPLDPLTRAQAAKIITEIVSKERIETSDPTVKKDGTKLSGRIYSNNVTIHKDLDDGSVSLDNCVILGKLIVQGGGEESVTVSNSRIVNALVNRSAGRVRLLAKGETTILETSCSGEYELETASLSGGEYGPGFVTVGVSGSSGGTLSGSFPHVSVDGSQADLKLLSGTISTLDVKSAGRRSNITVESKASVSQANVHGESYFHGAGTIQDMQVYAKGVTYETKPKKWTIQSGGETPSHKDPELVIAFEPAQGKTNVYLDTDITLTFNSAMREADGSSITNAEISKIVTLRKGSATGSIVEYTGTINSAKKVMTLKPTDALSESTRYYIVIKAGTMLDDNGEKNKAETSYFNTGKNTEKLVVTYTPASGEKSVAADRTSFTIQFSEGLTKYNGGTISTSDSYLQNSVILFRRGNANVSTNNYSVSINSARTRMTITLENKYELDLNTSYSLGIKAQTLKTAGGEAVPASTVTWTTAGLPVLSAASVTPHELSVDFKATSNVGGRIYAVLLASDAAVPSAARIRDGKDATDVAATASGNVAVSAGKSATVSLAGTDVSRDTAYKVYAVLYDGSGNASAVTSLAVTTEPLKLKTFTIVPDTDSANVLTRFKPDTLEYAVVVPEGTSYVTVEVSANASTFIGTLTINGKEPSNNQVDVSSGTATITVIVQEQGKRSVEYKATIEVAASAALESLTVDGAIYKPGYSADISIGSEPTSVTLVIVSKDSAASIKIGSVNVTTGDSVTLNLDATTTQVSFTIESADGLAEKTYTIKFNRDPIPEP